MPCKLTIKQKPKTKNLETVLAMNPQKIEVGTVTNYGIKGEFDANELSNELGGPKFANMVMLGAFLAVDDSVNIESVLEAFKKVFGKRKEKFIPVNRQALEAGYNAVMSQKK